MIFCWDLDVNFVVTIFDPNIRFVDLWLDLPQISNDSVDLVGGRLFPMNPFLVNIFSFCISYFFFAIFDCEISNILNGQAQCFRNIFVSLAFVILLLRSLRCGDALIFIKPYFV